MEDVLNAYLLKYIISPRFGRKIYAHKLQLVSFGFNEKDSEINVQSILENQIEKFDTRIRTVDKDFSGYKANLTEVKQISCAPVVEGQGLTLPCFYFMGNGIFKP